GGWGARKKLGSSSRRASAEDRVASIALGAGREGRARTESRPDHCSAGAVRRPTRCDSSNGFYCDPTTAWKRIAVGAEALSLGSTSATDVSRPVDPWRVERNSETGVALARGDL